MSKTNNQNESLNILKGRNRHRKETKSQFLLQPVKLFTKCHDLCQILYKKKFKTLN